LTQNWSWIIDSQCAAVAAAGYTALTHSVGCSRGPKCAISTTEAFNASMGFNTVTLGGGNDADIINGVMDLSVFKVRGSFYDPGPALVNIFHALCTPSYLPLRSCPIIWGQQR
jgi:hypothetical protein